MHDGAARRDRGRALRIGRTKHGDNGQSDCGSNVHRAGIVADEEMALRKQSGKVGDGRFSGKIDGRATHLGGDDVRNGHLCRGSEENDVGVGLRLEPVGKFRKT